MRLVFLGDSLTWGGYGGNFLDEVARLLPDHEIINAGHGGDTVINLLRRVDDVLNLKPDGVFVMVGGNDAISYTMPETRPYYRRSKAIPEGVVTPDMFTSAYRDLLTRLHTAHVLAWGGLEPNEYNPELVPAQRLYNERTREVAESLNVPVLDLMAAFPPLNVKPRPPLTMKTIRLIGEREASGWHDYEAERQREGYTFTFDGLHLTPDAANQIAPLIVDFLDI
jgi:lysophospholipase L1-like esterase